MKRFIGKGITATILVVALAFPPVTSVFAAGNPSGTGQPSQTCLSSTAPNEPGQAASAPGKRATVCHKKPAAVCFTSHRW